MNPDVTRLTQYPEIVDNVVGMASVNMMDEKLSVIRFAYETFMRIVVKSPFSVHPGALSVVLVIDITSFKRVKNSLFASVTTKFRCFATRFLSFVRFPTVFAGFCDNTAKFFASISPAVSRTILDLPGHIMFSAARAKIKNLFTKLAGEFDFLVPAFVVAVSGTEGCSPFFKTNTACWTLLHTPQSNINNC